MQTELIQIPNPATAQATIARAGDILRRGGLVAFPTETVYGLGANGLDAAACARIYEAKGRPSDNPLILHVADRAMIDTIAADVPPCAEKLLAAFCPGPITLILRRKTIVPDRITGGLATVGIRMPENTIARAMIRAAGVPIAAPSANISGRPSPTTAASVLRDMQGRIPLILDGGPCRYGVESTIIDCTETPATILRPGAITREMLEELLGGVRLDPALVGAHTVPKAPGMKYRHYAPKAPLTLIEGDGTRMDAAFRRQARILQQQGETVGILASHETCAALADLIPENLRKDYGPRGDLPAIAARIYEALISLDDTPATALLAEGTTERGLGLAIMNRLHKASGFHSLHCRKSADKRCLRSDSD